MKGLVGVEDGGEEAEGEGPDTKRHVEASVPEALEPLEDRRRQAEFIREDSLIQRHTPAEA